MDPSASNTPPPAAAPRRDLILLADDEEAIRIIARRTLEMFGYRVVTAANGQEALRLHTRHPQEIALVVTDMAMPGMDGAQLIASLVARDPGLRIITMSGYRVSEADGGPVLPPQVIGYLDKPFTAELLLRTIAAVLLPSQAAQPGLRFPSPA